MKISINNNEEIVSLTLKNSYILHVVRARSILYKYCINASTEKITSHVTLSSNTQFFKGVGEIMPFLYKIVSCVNCSSQFEIMIPVEAMGGALVPKTVCAQ